METPPDGAFRPTAIVKASLRQQGGETCRGDLTKIRGTDVVERRVKLVTIVRAIDRTGPRAHDGELLAKIRRERERRNGGG